MLMSAPISVSVNHDINLVQKILISKRIYLIGNGGSYANATHICNDLLACGVRAFTLDPATLTASANDYGYETVYARWIECVGEREDLLIALSGSGKSPNILNAITAAERIGMMVHRIFGAERGEGMQRAEENQLVTGHLLRAELMRLKS
jgi:D-sedoheptulose 7-phosphate isomerase